jgi:methyltransferase-like protein
MTDNPQRTASRYRQAEDLVSREIAGEVLLVPIRNNVGDLESIYTLNETGAFIWSHMDGTHTLSEIRTAMVEEFEVTEDEAWTDLIEFVDGLQTIPALVEVK